MRIGEEMKDAIAVLFFLSVMFGACAGAIQLTDALIGDELNAALGYSVENDND